MDPGPAVHADVAAGGAYPQVGDGPFEIDLRLGGDITVKWIAIFDDRRDVLDVNVAIIVGLNML